LCNRCRRKFGKPDIQNWNPGIRESENPRLQDSRLLEFQDSKPDCLNVCLVCQIRTFPRTPLAA
jgi:hypothetical protein